MTLYKMTGEKLEAVNTKTFTELGLTERKDIQRLLRTHVQAITPNSRTMVLAEEFGDWKDANRRIDLLCLDEQANLIVVELKRDDSSFMDLQALRYAAMISSMRFDQAVDAHRKFLGEMAMDLDPEQSIREFLNKDADEAVALSDTVRIVLAASDFSAELTTAVLWLNKQGLDIRCVQIRPHEVDRHVLWDINQVIPLPQEEQYQVALREKSQEQEAARRNGPRPRYDLRIGDIAYPNLTKRRLVLMVAREAFRQEVTIAALQAAIGNVFREIPNAAEIDSTIRLRYFTASDDLFKVGTQTFAFSNQWGNSSLEAVGKIIALMPQPSRVSFTESSSSNTD